MNRYQSYKESGVDWFGKIPSEWEVKAVKRRYKVQLGKMLQTQPSDEQDTLEPYLRAANIQWGYVDTTDMKSMWFSPRDKETFNVRSGDLLVSEGGDVGRSAVWNNDVLNCYMQNAVNRVRPINNNSNKFLYYWMFTIKHNGLIDSIVSKATIAHLTAEKLERLLAPFPPTHVQDAIAVYLDKETARIDQLIANKRQQIKKLDELRQITISNAVTRGLDPTVPMKDSGVAWLGEVPVHWRIRRVRDIALLLQTGPFGSQLHSDEYISDGVPVINPSHLIQGRITPDNKVTVDQQTHERLSRHSIHANDIIFARRGEMGRCALVTKDENGWLCGTGSLLFRPNTNRSYPPYHSFVLASKGIKEWLELRSVGSTMDNLNTEILGQIPLPMPPPNEQKSIHDFIDVESARFDKLTNNIKNQIDKLKELRKITINDAVTGKVKVTD